MEWLNVRGTPYSGQAKFIERFCRPIFGKLEGSLHGAHQSARDGRRESIESARNENQQFRWKIEID